MMSSWTRLARWISSTTAATSTASAVASGPASKLVIKARAGRSIFPGACTWSRRIGRIKERASSAVEAMVWCTASNCDCITGSSFQKSSIRCLLISHPAFHLFAGELRLTEIQVGLLCKGSLVPLLLDPGHEPVVHAKGLTGTTEHHNRDCDVPQALLTRKGTDDEHDRKTNGDHGCREGEETDD